jgi:hypothetical protein
MFLQNTTLKPQDRATRTPLKTGVKSGVSEVLVVPTPHVLLLLLIVHEQTDFVLDKHNEYNCNYC